MTYHTSVLLKQVITSLNLKKNGTYVDTTIGGGGHFKAIIEKLQEVGGGTAIGIDCDSDSIKFIESNLIKKEFKKVQIYILTGNFRDLKKVIEPLKIEKIDGILYDLGVSSHQIDEPERGFSYMNEGPLDMRMDKDLRVNAKDLINGLYEDELTKIFVEFGEEKFARRIAKSIVNYRKIALLNTTKELVNVIERSVPYTYEVGRSHKAKRVFQALRIAVNLELESLSVTLPQAFKILALQGRLSVISFHSLEDRIVKRFFKEKVIQGSGENVYKDLIIADKEELLENPRAKSAKLRTLSKIKEI